MSFIKVKEATEERLHLLHEPSQRSWGIFAALVIIGMAASIFSRDYIIWKLIFVTIAVLIGYSCVDDWEECVIDKKAGKIMFMKQSLLQKLCQINMDDKVVTEAISEVVGVQVRSQLTRYSGLAHTVDINFCSRPSIGVTTSLDLGNEVEHEQVAAFIRTFLGLPDEPPEVLTTEEEIGDGEHVKEEPADPEKKPQPEATTLSADLTSTEDDRARADLSGNSTSDESFEEIDRRELQESAGEEEATDAAAQDKEPLLACDTEKDKDI
ncbi:hypothetical protein NP493_440g01003 [Ridgeia piscesae]|uniref:Essential for reactive oxygen species protein n=1 Tax=Ridgeia piscesae TaxID=27915 RepID=A0AAD9L141_RIDPI|nr:hypothetical protein NP493_440g01003 [Ridgeia piscesae]